VRIGYVGEWVGEDRVVRSRGGYEGGGWGVREGDRWNMCEWKSDRRYGW
jgi:hypothetical protein